MRTMIYFIRHAESLYAEGQERLRGLSERGMVDALRVRTILQNESVEVFVSSPYERAVQTIKPLADAMHKEIIIVEDLRERTIGDIGGLSFPAAKQRVYQDFHLAFADGESSAVAQTRGVQALERLLEEYAGMVIALGTHGDIMTLIMNNYDREYGYKFWHSTTMPDIYRLVFEGRELIKAKRKWEE